MNGTILKPIYKVCDRKHESAPVIFFAVYYR